MVAGDFPQFTSSAYGSTTHALGAAIGNAAFGGINNFAAVNQPNQNWDSLQAQQAFEELNIPPAKRGKILGQLRQQENIEMSARRLVKVIIVDPNENIPLDQCVLYSGDEKLTDATDQELFFEIDIKNILDQHNTARTKIIDKKVKERTEHLEPAKIRDLKMVVVNIASF